MDKYPDQSNQQTVQSNVQIMHEGQKGTHSDVEDGQCTKSVNRPDRVARQDTVAKEAIGQDTVATEPIAKANSGDYRSLMEERVGPKLLTEESVQELVSPWEVGSIMRNIALRQRISGDGF